ncbi:uncharacterized protein LOC115878587 [Sitophilus oryzae]|uniref:Uncharacterized protein LOC115878587 n=1 Tax=Sitophilus oryzae TaxID=7048 RepID=A0A6J2XJA4_SITOR|nr:uncharacterized protein LOC115878587 [Sitophilus oryzae]
MESVPEEERAEKNPRPFRMRFKKMLSSGSVKCDTSPSSDSPKTPKSLNSSPFNCYCYSYDPDVLEKFKSDRSSSSRPISSGSLPSPFDICSHRLNICKQHLQLPLSTIIKVRLM